MSKEVRNEKSYQCNNIMIGQYNDGRKGQAFLFVFFLLLIVGILGGALAVMWQAEIKTRGADRDDLRAFYLAQAGVERAKIALLYNVNFKGDSSDFTDLDIAGDNYNFYYSFSISAVSGATKKWQRRIIGKGSVYLRKSDGSDGALVANRTIAVIVDGILDILNNTTRHPPADGKDDDLSGSTVSYTWHEQ